MLLEPLRAFLRRIGNVFRHIGHLLQEQERPEKRKTLKKMRAEDGEKSLSQTDYETASPCGSLSCNTWSCRPPAKGCAPSMMTRCRRCMSMMRQNFWWCFGCEKGGSVIDFYMELKQCDFKTAVAELGEMLFEQPVDELPLEEG